MKFNHKMMILIMKNYLNKNIMMIIFIIMNNNLILDFNLIGKKNIKRDKNKNKVNKKKIK